MAAAAFSFKNERIFYNIAGRAESITDDVMVETRGYLQQMMNRALYVFVLCIKINKKGTCKALIVCFHGTIIT